MEFHEFTHFWEVVKGAGHPESEITEELESIKKGEGWVGFDDIPKPFRNTAEDGEESKNQIKRGSESLKLHNESSSEMLPSNFEQLSRNPIPADTKL